MIGERIRELRKQKGLTQKKLGELCGILEPTIRKYELGSLNPKLSTIEKISNALGVSAFDIMGADYFDKLHGKEYTNALSDDVKALEIIKNKYGESAVKLLEYYSQLNNAGAKKVLDFISDIALIEQYTNKNE